MPAKRKRITYGRKKPKQPTRLNGSSKRAADDRTDDTDDDEPEQRYDRVEEEEEDEEEEEQEDNDVEIVSERHSNGQRRPQQKQHNDSEDDEEVVELRPSASQRSPKATPRMNGVRKQVAPATVESIKKSLSQQSASYDVDALIPSAAEKQPDHTRLHSGSSRTSPVRVAVQSVSVPKRLNIATQSDVDNEECKREAIKYAAMEAEYQEVCNRYDYLKSLRETEAERLLNECKMSMMERAEVSNQLIAAQKERIDTLLREQEKASEMAERLQESDRQQQQLLAELNSLRIERDELLQQESTRSDPHDKAIIAMYQRLTNLSISVSNVLPNGDANFACEQITKDKSTFHFALSNTSDALEADTDDGTPAAVAADTVLDQLLFEPVPAESSAAVASASSWLSDAFVFGKDATSTFYVRLLKALGVVQ